MNIEKMMLVSDYDQTFYLNDLDIEKNKVAIKEFRRRGNLFVIATGRSYDDFIKKRDLYKIQYDYLIINHGATILTSNDEIVYNKAIDNQILEELQKDLELEKSLKYFCCSKLESRVGFEHQYLTKIHIKYENKEITSKINNKIVLKYKNYINSYLIRENEIEIISNKTNKSEAVEYLIQDLSVSSDIVYTIGDSYSDIEMVRDFNGYSMKDSVDELKKVSKEELDSVSILIDKLMSGDIN